MNRSPLLLSAFALVGAASVAPLSTAHACAALSRDGTPIRTVDEAAVIAWNPATQEERFVRRASFEHAAAGSADTGFLVPTPTQPTLEAIDNSLFVTLEDYVNDKVVPISTGGNSSGDGGGCGSSTLEDGASAPGTRAGVDVVEEVRVGGQDATVLKASDAKALEQWLGAHDFTITPEVSTYLQRYVDNGWYLTAFQYVARNGSRIDTQAVSMRFQTPAPFYPYREAASPAPSSEPRSLRIFTLSPSEMVATKGLGDTPWAAGRSEWSGSLDESARPRLPAGLALAAGTKLSVFEDRSSPRNGDEEVYFEAHSSGTLSRVLASPFGLLALAGVVWRKKTARRLMAAR